MNSAMKKLRLEKVTYANYDEILKLCVSEEQAEFVADNEFSLVDAYLTIADIMMKRIIFMRFQYVQISLIVGN